MAALRPFLSVRSTIVALATLWSLIVASEGFARDPEVAREDDPVWKEFVVGKVDDLPDGPVKKFLVAAHWNNPYAATIVEQTKKLGPFAPEADNIFWIPTIDVPMTKENWRFLSSLDDLPKAMRKLTSYRKGGQTFVRMFLHPYTTQEPSFVQMAEKFGGFKYEFQGSTTASVRSLVAWKTEVPKPSQGVGRLEFPRDPDSFLWPKVSVTRADIDGSRLNPAKKMVRAYAVTRLMEDIPPETKAKVGFEFAGEWLVGVPTGTDAGFVTREVLPAFTARGGKYVEPGFSVFSPKRLRQLVGNVAHPELWVKENLIRPVFRTVAYLMMVEGMVGEYHNQNFNYVIGRDGVPSGEILLHDADAFRTSILLRAMQGKETGTIRKIDAPFYFMKDGVFTQSEGSASEYGLNALINAYFSDPAASDSVAGFVKTWCKTVQRYRAWCTNRELKKIFNDTLSEELAPYVGHSIDNLDLSDRVPSGKVGLLTLFKERMAKVSEESKIYQSVPIPELQEELFEEYSRLVKAGRGKSMSASITLENSSFLLDIKNGNAVIHVVAKDSSSGRPFKGMALLALSDDPLAVEFAERVEEIAGISIPMGTVDGLRGEVLAKPWMSNIGGGSNIPASVHEYLADRDAGIVRSISKRNCPRVFKPRAPRGAAERALLK